MNQYPIRAERFVVEMVPVIESSEDVESNPMILANSTVAVSHPEYSNQTQDIRAVKTEPSSEPLDIPPEVVEMALDNMNRLDTVSLMHYFSFQLDSGSVSHSTLYLFMKFHSSNNDIASLYLASLAFIICLCFPKRFVNIGSASRFVPFNLKWTEKMSLIKVNMQIK